MLYLSAVALVLAVAGLSNTQSIDPNTVPISDRRQWCQAQRTQCPLICLQLPDSTSATESNTCDPETLSFSCVCSNGQSPNASEYSQTIPYFQCMERGNQCVEACGQDNACSTSCREDHPCGAQDPARITTSAMTSTTASRTGDPAANPTDPDSEDYSNFGAQETGSSGQTDAAFSAIDVGRSYGLAIVAATIFAGFALFL